MSKEKRVWGVLFTDTGLNDMGKALEPYLSKGPIGAYLYCKQVEMNLPLFRMVADYHNDDGSTYETEIYVPHQYVKFVIRGNKTDITGCKF